MRSAEQKLLNAVQRPEAYGEVVLGSAGARIVLSVWDGTIAMPVVLFLPGTMTHPLLYEEFLDALSRAGLALAGLHGQGHGKSPRAHRPFTFTSLVENARDAVTWIRQAFPGRPLAVIGSSQGSVLAMALAAADHRIDAVFAHNIADPALPSAIHKAPPHADPRLPGGPGRLPYRRPPRPGGAGPVRRLPRDPPGLP